jgi:hypothetical protein
MNTDESGQHAPSTFTLKHKVQCRQMSASDKRSFPIYFCLYPALLRGNFKTSCFLPHGRFITEDSVFQKSETTVMHLSFNLLRIKALYMFRALLVHPQESLHKQHLVYCVRVMSVGCYQDWSGPQSHSNPRSSQLTYQARNIPSAVCVAPPEYE